MVHLFGIDIHHAHAPLKRLSPVPMEDVRRLPILITASYGDTLVRRSANANVCAAEARAKGALVYLANTTGEHDDPSNWEPARLVHFLAGAALLARLRRGR